MNIAVDGVDDVLVGPFIGGDEAEVVSIRKSDDLHVFKRVSKLVFKALERVKDGVKDHEEDYLEAKRFEHIERGQLENCE